jgi:hypothetical protein
LPTLRLRPSNRPSQQTRTGRSPPRAKSSVKRRSPTGKKSIPHGTLRTRFAMIPLHEPQREGRGGGDKSKARSTLLRRESPRTNQSRQDFSRLPLLLSLSHPRDPQGESEKSSRNRWCLPIQLNHTSFLAGGFVSWSGGPARNHRQGRASCPGRGHVREGCRRSGRARGTAASGSISGHRGRPGGQSPPVGVPLRSPLVPPCLRQRRVGRQHAGWVHLVFRRLRIGWHRGRHDDGPVPRELRGTSGLGASSARRSTGHCDGDDQLFPDDHRPADGQRESLDQRRVLEHFDDIDHEHHLGQ